MGAAHAGMQAVRLDRKGTPWEPFDGEPDRTVESIHELADALGV
jgi:2-haloacid dehalogenase